MSNTENRQQRNKAPAELQITAEQILHESYERKESPVKAPNYKIEDLEELHEFQRRKRTEYENYVRRNRLNFGQWMRYAQFEIEQHDFVRARSVFERALEVDHKTVVVWVRYIQTEIKGGNINHARNLLDRATKILPRVNKLWFQYVSIEESLSNIIGTRAIFKNWLKWKPGSEVWDAYIQFETRYEEYDNARLIFEKYVIVKPEASTWLKWIKFEQKNGDSANVRNVYKLALASLRSFGNTKEDTVDEKILISWSNWEISEKNTDEARKILKHGLDIIKNEKKRQFLLNALTEFEKQYGDKENIENTIVSKRFKKYQLDLKSAPSDYDTWWIYLSLAEETPELLGSTGNIRKAYDSCLEVVPTSDKKADWLKYIYICIRYLIWEEYDNREIEKTRNLFKKVLKLIPHKIFTFTKIWINFAEFEIRQGDLQQARKILGRSLGMCPNQTIFDYYINLEIKLKEFDRVRGIYTKLLEVFPKDSNNWINFANFEDSLGDEPRCTGLYDLGISEDSVPKNERVKIFKAYIGYCIDEKDFSKAKKIYDKLVDFTNHNIQICISRCLFEISIPNDEQLNDYLNKVERLGEDGEDESLVELEFSVSEESKQNARNEFNKAIEYYKDLKDNKNCVIMIKSLIRFEMTHGNAKSKDEANSKLPTIEKRSRLTEGGVEEEYLEYVYPKVVKEEEKEQVKVKTEDTDDKKFFIGAGSSRWSQGETLQQ